MNVHAVFLAAFLAFAISAQPAPAAAMPADMVAATRDAGPLRLVLAVLPAEPFLTKAQAQHGAPGMIAVGGASPVDLEAPSHPNHHLVIHIYNRSSGLALRGGHVTMSFTLLGSSSDRAIAVSVPVVEMQAAGKGPQSTHYGNNVFMRAGTYRVAVSINGSAPTVFTIEVT